MVTRSRGRPGHRHRRAVRAALAVLVALAGLTPLAASRAAGVNPPRVSLAWAAPVECPGREAVVADVIRILGPAVLPNPKVTARASVERADASTWKGTVTILTEDGASLRTFVGSSCDAVAATVSLIVAIAIGPLPAEPSSSASSAASSPAPAPSQAASASPSPSPSPSALPAPPVPSATASAAPSSTAPRGEPAQPEQPEQPEPEGPTPPARARESHLTASALAGLDVGTLPSPGVGALVALGWLGELGPGRLRLEGEAGAWAVQRTTLSTDANEGADLSLLTFGARACYGLVLGRIELAPCGGVELGRIQATGFSTQKPLDGYGLWAAPRAGLLASWAATHWLALRLGLDAGFAVSPPQFVVETSSAAGSLPLFHPAAVSGRGTLGVELRFL